MPVRHIALFRFAETAGEEDVAALSEALGALPAQIPELRDYRFGPDLGLSDRTWDYAVVADVDDADGYERYRTHPAHVDVLDRHVNPLVAERAAVQVSI